MIGNIFNVFSRREAISELKIAPLTNSFKNRFLLLMKDSLNHSIYEVLDLLQKKLLYLHGRSLLCDTNRIDNSSANDVLQFLSQCEDAHFLDSIEYFFQIKDGILFSQVNKSELIDQINNFFAIDGIPYYLTKYVYEKHESTQKEFIPIHISSKIIEYPKIIRKDCEVLHNTAIKPVLALLQKHDLLNANEEFLQGLEDYRKGIYKDCLTKCCSSLESVMKVICKRKGLKYKENDSARSLLLNIIKNSNLDSFWEQPIIIIATIRNKLSSAHGSGTKTKNVPEHVAKYTINITASAILFLHDEAYN